MYLSKAFLGPNLLSNFGNWFHWQKLMHNPPHLVAHFLTSFLSYFHLKNMQSDSSVQSTILHTSVYSNQCLNKKKVKTQVPETSNILDMQLIRAGSNCHSGFSTFRDILPEKSNYADQFTGQGELLWKKASFKR